MVTPNQPIVSVVIPSLNRSHYLVPTIESVLQQDYPHIECIVVDGGSTDGTLDILRSYDERIRWVSEPDQGPPDAINKGWRMCTGEILAWLNADDVWAPGAVSAAVSYFLEHPEADVVYGDCGIIDQDGRHIRTVRVREWDLEYAVLHCDHIVYQAASFMRRTILERVGWLYPKLCHDHELWLRIALAGGNFQHIQDFLAYTRQHEGNLGSRSDIVVPLKLELTRNFFANPLLPGRFNRIRNRAISNANLRGIEYILRDRLRWKQYWPRILGLIWKAFRVDPTNGLRVFMRLLEATTAIFLRPVSPFLPNWLLDMLIVLKRQLWGWLLRERDFAKD